MSNYEIYIIVHVKDPSRSNLAAVMDQDTSWLCLLAHVGWDPASVTGLEFIHILLTATGPPGGPYASPPSVVHPGLPDLDHIVGIPIKYTHNNGLCDTTEVPLPLADPRVNLEYDF
jgi:hypothetical protein